MRFCLVVCAFFEVILSYVISVTQHRHYWAHTSHRDVWKFCCISYLVDVIALVFYAILLLLMNS